MKTLNIEGNEARIKKVREILDSLKTKDVYASTADGFSSDKEAIQHIFEMTKRRTKSEILLRLTVIDSMYSTQMNRRYYGLQELAEKLDCLNHKQALPKLFAEFIKQQNIDSFNGAIGKVKFNLWAEKYGIGKNGKDRGVAVSLISKYAYFETGYEFPIFDSIACEMYPRIWKYCGWKDKAPILKVNDKNQQLLGDKTILTFITAIDELIKRLGGNISYDHLDRLLWFSGKIYRGNLSLVLERKDYEWCTAKWKQYQNKEGNFDIVKLDVSQAPFCSTNSRLKAMFQLAKDLKNEINSN